MIVDVEKVASVIREIAIEEILSRYGRLKNGQISTKSGPNDFVTEADVAAERKLARALEDLCPGAVFVGEEGAAKDPSLIDKLGSEGTFWIVDPLDGTRNFINERPQFGTIVALVVDGQICAGWIYAIPDDAMAIGSSGEGVSYKGSMLQSPLPRSDTISGYRAVGNLDEPWKSTLLPAMRSAFKTDPAHCSAYGYLDLIRARREFALYSRCHPWDHAAGVLMVSELGGRAEYLDTGEDYRPYPSRGRPLLVANSQAHWRDVLERLIPS